MANNEEKLLQKTIEEARAYQAERSPYSLEYYLMQLNEANQSENKALWAALRAAMAENSALKLKAQTEFFTRPSLAKKGYWWWNPQAWKIPEEVSA